MINEQIPGFFGKVSTHGDFVARRLPPEFIQAWDGWLQQSLQKSREQLGPAWLDTYLTSPVWRFALAPGLCGSDAWAGVLMPSVDRVGRHFPLTVCAPLHGSFVHCPTEAKDWYDRAESLALRTLDKDYGLEAFEADLAVLPPVATGGPAVVIDSVVSGNRQVCFEVSSVQQLSMAANRIADEIGALRLGIRSMWWSDGSSLVAPSLLSCEGLPLQTAFVAMLDGKWIRRGWQLWRGA